MRIDSRFCGPPNSGNGGYTAGRVASLIRGPAEVDSASSASARDRTGSRGPGRGAVLRGSDGNVIAEGVPHELELDVPVAVSWEQAQHATSHYIGFRDHPLSRLLRVRSSPRCGARTRSRSFPGAMRDSAGRSVVAAPFRPPAELADEAGLLEPEFVWAALDCPSWFGHAAFAANVPKILLGRLAVRITRRPRAGVDGERCVVMGWGLGQQGRRITCGSALYDEQGECLARGKAVWIELKSA